MGFCDYNWNFALSKGSVTGGGVGACHVSWLKIVENFDSLIKIFNILKSSIQSIQIPAFS